MENTSITYTPKLTFQVLLYNKDKQEYFVDILEFNNNSIPWNKPTALAFIFSNYVYPEKIQFKDVISCDLTYLSTYHDTNRPEIIAFQHEYFVEKKIYETVDI